jgi:hypothetical protein
MTAKNAPYPPRHRDHLLAKEPIYLPGWLRRVALTHFIAEPLGFIAEPADKPAFRKFTMTQKFLLYIEKFHIGSLKP